MPFWKAGKNDDQVLDELKETQKQNADEFVKKQEHADEAQKSSLIIDNNFTPVEYDPQYILQVNHLKKYFPIKGGMVSKTVGYVKAVDGVTFNLKRGTTMGLVGESGCGKTTTGRTILRLYDSKSGGQVLFNGQEVYDLSHKELRALRTKMQIIFQDPFSSLSPRMPVGEIIGEAVREHNLVPKAEFDDYIDQVMDNCGLQPFHKDRYPHEFSGGMRQRVVIAIAMACVPEILICDEPTTALDVTIQAQILDLLKKLQANYGLTVIYITHDLGVVANVADRIAVMYAGDIVEIGTCDEVFYDPKHPYTWALLSSLPQLGIKGEDLYSIQGTPPNLFQHIQGDAFAPRNPQALKVDFVARPPYFEVTPTHKARTWLLDPRAPKIDPPLHLKNIMNLNRGGDLSNG